MKILAIGAHPDDIEFGVGGLIIKEAKKGAEIKYLVCSLGEAGSNGTPEGRKKESEEAAKLAGASIGFLDLGGDCHIEDTPQNAIKIAAEIRKFKPNIILAPEMQRNQHPDHYTIAKIAHSACRLARYGGLKELKKMDTHKINGLYFYTVRGEWPPKPDIVIDVTAEKEEWSKTMSAHKSQMASRDYHDLILSKSAAMGVSIGTKYAIGLWVNDPVRVNYLSDLSLSSRNY